MQNMQMYQYPHLAKTACLHALPVIARQLLKPVKPDAWSLAAKD